MMTDGFLGSEAGTFPPIRNFRRPYIGATYLNPVLPHLPGLEAVRRVNFDPCSEKRVHHILHQKYEPRQAKNLIKIHKNKRNIGIKSE